jgi:signal transduction histidine kinase
MPRWLWVLLGEIVVVASPVAAALLSHPTPFSFALPTALLASAALPLRLRWPWLAMLLCLPGLVGGLGWPPAIIALYRIGRVYRFRVTLVWVSAGLTAMLLPLHLKLAMPWQDRVMSVAFSVVGLLGPAAFGALVRLRRELIASLAETRRARSAELEARIESARAAERARIAREIHDAVGHHATLIAVQSAALAATAPDDATREAALRLRVLARESLAEMRAALGLLNDTARPLGLADLPDLLTRVCRAGLHIDFDGDVSADDTSPAVGRAIYRIVQEALTNVTKHAPASSVQVRLVRDTPHVLVSIVNTPPTRPPTPATDDPGGTGLEGLTERVNTVGGTLRAQLLPDGGFSVLAELPLHPPTKVEPAHSTSGGTTPTLSEP